MSFATHVPAYATGLQTTPEAQIFTFRSGLQTVSATILADARRGSINITRIQLRPSFNYIRDCVWQTSMQRGHRIQRVVSVRSPNRWSLRIQTTFGQESHLDSAYGRGTTAADEHAGTTSLEFHESQHGELALNYINTHALPVLNITTGMTRQQVVQQMRGLNTELRHYNRTLEYLQIQEVDCVGVPMSESACR